MTTDDIQTLHRVYCQLTGFDLRLDFDRERAWSLFEKKFTVEDLKLVLAHLKNGIRKGHRYLGSLGFTRLIWGLDVFEEELCQARAYLRNNKPQTNRQSVIKVFFRPTVAEAPVLRRPGGGGTGATVNCRPVGNLIPKLLAEMRKAAE